MPDRTRILTAVIADLTEKLDAVETMARLAADEVTSDETRSEGKYDTRSIEASYLARGQAERVASLRSALSAVRALPRAAAPDGPIGVGRVVELLAEDDTTRWVLLVPTDGGNAVTVDGVLVRVVSPESPFGRALLGASVDDEVEVFAGGGEQIYEVVSVA